MSTRHYWISSINFLTTFSLVNTKLKGVLNKTLKNLAEQKAIAAKTLHFSRCGKAVYPMLITHSRRPSCRTPAESWWVLLWLRADGHQQPWTVGPATLPAKPPSTSSSWVLGLSTKRRPSITAPRKLPFSLGYLG